MLIAFIGAPCSGKTTTAAMVFAALKDAGQAAEFVPEQARIYIAQRKIAKCQADGAISLAEGVYGGRPPWNTPIELTDEDQLAIGTQQAEADKVMTLSSGPWTTVVADSSPVNSLFYMSDAFRHQVVASPLFQEAIRQTRIFFYVKPIANQSLNDPNRLHDAKFSAELDHQILPLLGQLCPDMLSKVIPLMGHAEERKCQALSVYYNAKFPTSEK